MGRYETDFYAWANEQAGLLRAGRLSEADIANIAEEIESMGRSEKRELVNRLSVLLAHLLKWMVQGTFRGTHWGLTIEEQRARLKDHLEDNPSLKPLLPQGMGQGYRLAVLVARGETGLERSSFPAQNPWSPVQVLDEEFYPE